MSEKDSSFQYVNRIENYLMHFHITSSDVVQKISKIKSKKGAIEKVPYIVFVDFISSVLVYLFDLSLTSGVLSSSLKTARVTPISNLVNVRIGKNIVLPIFLRDSNTKDYSNSLLKSI